ncbi:MAG: bifunctional lysylphosphatidylglycerol flippase/synthetase MprF, partial [Candidatus Xenobia bacterium]
QGLSGLATALAFTLVYGVLGFTVLQKQFRTPYSLSNALRHTLSLMVLDQSDVIPATRFADFFAWSISVVFVVSLIYAVYLILRPVLLRSPASGAERARARQVVERFGHTSLAPFALLTDKSYFFSLGGSVVAYVAKGPVALALADPIGPPEDVRPAIAAFAAFCRDNDWTPAFMQTAHDTVADYEAEDFEVCAIGTEAVVDLSTFTMQGGGARNMRSLINRVKKSGYRVEVHDAPQSDELLREMKIISDEWLTLMHGTEKQFCLGWFEVEYLRSCPVCCVYDEASHLVAFANILTEYQKPEATGDLMRRRREVENGTMEFLFVSLFEWAKAKGFLSFSLGLCPLAGIGEQREDRSVERALHHIYEHVNQFYNFKGLHAFKEKFHPSWSPRYLVYPPRSLPEVTIAMIRATNGDTFFLDSLRDLLKGSTSRKAPS